MITSIRLQEFKGHRDTTVPLDRLTVLVGPNGSGKTSVLDALWLQSRLLTTDPYLLLIDDWSIGDIHRRGATGPVVLLSEGKQQHAAWRCQIDIKAIESVGTSWSGPDEARRALGRAAFYKLNAQRIAAAAYSDASQPSVERDGTNTSEVLSALKLGNDEAFSRVEEDMRRIIPNVERVRIRPATAYRSTLLVPRTMEPVKGSKIFFDFRGAPGVPAHAASEGTLITLAILTVLHGPERPSILLLDDFDQSLHPQAQMELVRLIKRLLDEHQDLQIVATTHSPYILDELEPSQVHGFALRDDGTVATRPLSQHPEAEKTKGALTAGQLWSLDPEPKWVLAQP